MIALAAPALSLMMLRRHPAEWSGPMVGACVVAAMLAFARGGNQLGWFAAVAGVVALVTALLPAVVALHYPALGVSARERRRVTRCWWLTVALGLAAGVSGMLDWVGAELLVDHRPSRRRRDRADGPPADLCVGRADRAVAHSGRRDGPLPIDARGGRPALRPVVVPLIGWAVATALEIGWLVAGTVTGPEADVRQEGTTPYFTMLPTLLVVMLAAGIGGSTPRFGNPPSDRTRTRPHRGARYGRET